MAEINVVIRLRKLRWSKKKHVIASSMEKRKQVIYGDECNFETINRKTFLQKKKKLILKSIAIGLLYKDGSTFPPPMQVGVLVFGTALILTELVGEISIKIESTHLHRDAIEPHGSISRQGD